MSKPTPKPSADSDQVYQIRLKGELKLEFMDTCHGLALNPSAVLRMLMGEWTRKNRPARTHPKAP